jgi:pimeloyl-ACP methyl ester carboxylesterase
MNAGRAVAIGARNLPGILRTRGHARGVVAFAHGSGSSRLSPRNVHAAERLGEAGFATLLFDLLSEHETSDRRNVFDIPLLGGRVTEAIDWLGEEPSCAALPLGLFGASTGAAAAIVAAAARKDRIQAVVSRGGRPDLAGEALGRIQAPTLLIVGALDVEVLALNQRAMRQMSCPHALEVIAGAGHLFEEPGTLDAALDAASDWFISHLGEGS